MKTLVDAELFDEEIQNLQALAISAQKSSGIDKQGSFGPGQSP